LSNFSKWLFTLKFIIYIRSHTIQFDVMSTLANSKNDAINKFILYNMEEIQPWVALHEEKRREGNGTMTGKNSKG